jgi:hypothetical protein
LFSSWNYDITDKAAKYAAFGVGEYWALHAVTRQSRIRRGPSAGGWADVRELVAPARLVPLCAEDAGFAVWQRMRSRRRRASSQAGMKTRALGLDRASSDAPHATLRVWRPALHDARSPLARACEPA